MNEPFGASRSERASTCLSARNLGAVPSLPRHGDGPRIAGGGDHELRKEMVLPFYRRYLPEGKLLEDSPHTAISESPRAAASAAPPECPSEQLQDEHADAGEDQQVAEDEADLERQLATGWPLPDT